jgi:HK97 family phage portal protein
MGLFDVIGKAFGSASSAMLAVVNYAIGGDRDAPSIKPRVAYGEASWAYACVHQIAQHGSSVPLVVQNADGEPLDNDIAYLLSRPNPETDAARLIYYTLACQELYGDAYWWLVRSNEQAKTPASIWPLRPEFVSANAGKTGEARVTGYTWRYGGQEIDIPARDMVHFNYWSPTSDVNGHAPLEAAMLAIGADYEAALHNYQFVKHGASPSGILTAQGRLTSDQKKALKNQWRNEIEGTKNAGKVAVLDQAQGFNFTQIGLSQKDAQYLEARRMNREEILGVFGVPPVIVSLYDDVNHATAGDQRRQFWSDTIKPKMELIASTLTLALEPKFGAQRGAQVSPDLSTVEALQPDYAMLVQSAVTAAGGKPVMTINEARDLLLDLPELSGEELETLEPAPPPQLEGAPDDADESGGEEDAETRGEERSLPRMLAFATDDAERKALGPAGDTDSLRKAIWTKQMDFQEDYVGRIGDVVSRVYRTLTDEVVANIEADLAKGYKATNPEVLALLFDLDEAGELVMQELSSVELAAYIEAGEHVVDLFGLAAEFDADTITAQQWYAEKQLKIVTLPETYHEQIRDSIDQVLADGRPLQEAIDEIEALYEEQYGDRNTPGAKRIAETEMNDAYSAATDEAYDQNGVEKHEWIHSFASTEPRPSHLASHGEVRERGELFTSGLSRPHGPEGGPEDVIWCRCTTAPVIDEDDKPDTPPVPEGYGE